MTIARERDDRGRFINREAEAEAEGGKQARNSALVVGVCLSDQRASTSCRLGGAAKGKACVRPIDSTDNVRAELEGGGGGWGVGIGEDAV